MLWAWCGETAPTDLDITARKNFTQHEGGQPELVSYQAFVKLLMRESTMLLFALVEALLLSH